MKLALTGAALALTITATPASAATNLLTNGSFESGFTGWTQSLSGMPVGTAPVVIAYNQASQYPTGAFGEAIGTNTVTSASPDAVGNSLAYFSSDTANPHSLSQLVNLVAGTVYNIGFDYYVPRNGYDNPFDATLGFTVGGTAVGTTLSAGSPSGTPVASWQNFATSFTATSSGPQSVAFNFRGGGVTAADFGVDRVYVTAAVPEPGTWALMLFGFGAVGVAMRRRRPLLQMA
ncbi:PEPxxWA-CTERM sorting domain-containing protein [Sphingomonas glaciei]|uniref:PEPxxWA-CTERM sorting domain-containing protein n=1 Tax=Sphingomonas glaciei TaxID=2938948 RepID=A0ABY5MS03_9SPHN|nr:PEPxxWA-CTERM sorting domain-containing protein [Sphingomonas glaciei]UUR07265.1 PEPxxWA-CTERM sorting domain-containing protein [Sphingomonas glaciei]